VVEHLVTMPKALGAIRNTSKDVGAVTEWALLKLHLPVNDDTHLGADAVS
jgi:hypothetical protein